MASLIGAAAGLIAGVLLVLLAGIIPIHLEDEENKSPAVEPPAGQGESPALPVVESPRPRFRFGALEIGLALVSAALTAAAFQREGLSLTGWILSVYIWILLLICLIDIRHRLILDVVMIPAFAFALIELVASRRISVTDGLIGYAIGQIAVAGVYIFGAVYLWVVNSGREEKVEEVPFGFGDVTLATFCGLMLGYPRAVLMLLLMVIVGALMAFLTILINLLRSGRHQSHMVIPYGPAIASAAIIMLLWGEAVARLLGAP